MLSAPQTAANVPLLEATYTRSAPVPAAPQQYLLIGDFPGIVQEAHGGQCVAWIQQYLSVYYTHPAFRGHARDIVPNTSEPSLGAAVLTTEGEGHAALIIAIDEDELVLAESNYNGDERIDVGRRLQIDNPIIRGYFNFEQ